MGFIMDNIQKNSYQFSYDTNSSGFVPQTKNLAFKVNLTTTDTTKTDRSQNKTETRMITIAAKKWTGGLGEKLMSAILGRIKIQINGEAYLVKAKEVSEKLGISKKEIRETRIGEKGNTEQFKNAVIKNQKMNLAFRLLKQDTKSTKDIESNVETLHKQLNLDDTEKSKLKEMMNKEINSKYESELNTIIKDKNNTHKKLKDIESIAQKKGTDFGFTTDESNQKIRKLLNLNDFEAAKFQDESLFDLTVKNAGL